MDLRTGAQLPFLPYYYPSVPVPLSRLNTMTAYPSPAI